MPTTIATAETPESATLVAAGDDETKYLPDFIAPWESASTVQMQDIFVYADIEYAYVTPDNLVRLGVISRRTSKFIEVLAETIDEAMEMAYDKLINMEWTVEEICHDFGLTVDELRELVDLAPVPTPISIIPLHTQVGQPLIVAVDDGIYRIERIDEDEDADDIGSLCD